LVTEGIPVAQNGLKWVKALFLAMGEDGRSGKVKCSEIIEPTVMKVVDEFGKNDAL
jgi:hypothetical protein